MRGANSLALNPSFIDYVVYRKGTAVSSMLLLIDLGRGSPP
jgi:hypothetical protein